MARIIIPKSRCPHCMSTKYKTLKGSGEDRVTRCCKKPVVVVNHRWHVTLDDAPEWMLISKFAEMMNELGPRDIRGNYTISHGDATYQQTLDGARTILDRCTQDVDLALECVNQHFTNDKFSWRVKKGAITFYAVLSKYSWDGLLANARAARKKQAREAATQAGRVSSVDRRYLEAAHADTAI